MFECLDALDGFAGPWGLALGVDLVRADVGGIHVGSFGWLHSHGVTMDSDDHTDALFDRTVADGIRKREADVGNRPSTRPMREAKWLIWSRGCR